MKNIVILLVVSVLTGFTLNAQQSKYEKDDYSGSANEESVMPPIFGVGINLTQFQFSDLFSDWYGSPANKIMLTVTPMKSLRIEPEFGMLSFKREETDGNGQTHDLKDKMIAFGIGAFGMMQRGNTNMYGGLRYENAQMQSQWLDSNTDWMSGTTTYTVVKDEGTRSTIAPTIGAEYFFGQHFSIGGEFSLRIMKINSKPYGSSVTQVEDHITTGAGLQMRFYL